MLNIVVPMAGAGSRFANAGYELPKPLIQIHGKPMIQYVIENIRPTFEHKFIFVVQSEHVSKYKIDNLLEHLSPGSKVITIPGLTRGAAETVLAAENEIDSEMPLMIANSDQFVAGGLQNYLAKCYSSNADGYIMTMLDNDPKWSYVKRNQDGQVTEIVEKQVVSNEATVGIYNFRKAKFFIENATSMINNRELVAGEYYVAPVYNKLIMSGGEVDTFSIGDIGSNMFGLGIPEDLQFFESQSWTKNIISES